MLHIILLILKILGCIILGILALLLAAVLIVLFVPFKYELSAAYDGNPEASGKLSWLFGTIRVWGEFKDKKLRARASVLWFYIFNMDETADTQTNDAPEETEESSASAELPKSPELQEAESLKSEPAESERPEPESPPTEKLEADLPADHYEADLRKPRPLLMKRPGCRKEKDQSRSNRNGWRNLQR